MIHKAQDVELCPPTAGLSGPPIAIVLIRSTTLVAAVADWQCGGWERGDVRDGHLSHVFANELGSWEEVLLPGAWGFSDSYRPLCHEPMPAAILTTVAASKKMHLNAHGRAEW